MNAQACGLAAEEGLNYRQLCEALGTALARPAGEGSRALLLTELLDVRQLQGRLGFAGATELIATVARRFAGVLGTRGSVYLFEGDRICVLLDSVRNGGHAQLAAERLGRMLEESFAQGEIGSNPRAHTGIALCPSQAQEAQGLLRLAQLAALAASTARQRVRQFDPTCEQRAVADWELRDHFALALRSGDLSVHLQPKMHIVSGRLAGAEALMRWLGPDGSPLATPDVFVPIAEEAGLMQDLTWFAITNALQHSLALDHLPVAVNVPPATLHHPDFTDMIRTALAHWEVAPRALTIEITESALVGEPQAVSARLEALRALGARISIDDFGTGYSSLSYFRTLEADELKIDRSFIEPLTAGAGSDERVVSTILALAREFRLSTVAEGVEDVAICERLGRLGCDVAQGFLYSPALNVEAFGRWAAGRERIAHGD